jgi:hypothetical protein
MNFTAAPWTLRRQLKAGAHPLIQCSDGLAPFALERTPEELEANAALLVNAPALFNALHKVCKCIEADTAIHEAYNEAIEILKLANGE